MPGARVVLKDSLGNLVDLGADEAGVDELIEKAKALLSHLRDKPTPYPATTAERGGVLQPQWPVDSRQPQGGVQNPDARIFRQYPPPVPGADETQPLPRVEDRPLRDRLR